MRTDSNPLTTQETNEYFITRHVMYRHYTNGNYLHCKKIYMEILLHNAVLKHMGKLTHYTLIINQFAMNNREFRLKASYHFCLNPYGRTYADLSYNWNNNSLPNGGTVDCCGREGQGGHIDSILPTITTLVSLDNTIMFSTLKETLSSLMATKWQHSNTIFIGF